MCPKPPAPPINKPDYQPEEAHTRFISKVTKEDGTTEELPQATTPKAPTVKTTQTGIRM